MPGLAERLADAAAERENLTPPYPSFDAETRGRIAELRKEVRVVLLTLADSLEQRLGPALHQALRAWDQADEVTIIDEALEERLATARALIDGALASPLPPLRAVASEAVLTLRAACGLVALVERRLSPLIRLRVRSAERDLLPDGRPFLDLAPALAEAARSWV